MWQRPETQLGVGLLLEGTVPIPEEPRPLKMLVAPTCQASGNEPGGGVTRARLPLTYPEGPQGVVGAVRLLPAAPVHQALQLDEEELLGSGGTGGRRRTSGHGLGRPVPACPSASWGGGLPPGGQETQQLGMDTVASAGAAKLLLWASVSSPVDQGC